MSKEAHMLPVWFFIGVLLTIYGVIILCSAVVNFSEPTTAVLAQYHPALFGGIVLLAIGGFYTIWYWPGRRKQK